MEDGPETVGPVMFKGGSTASDGMVTLCSLPTSVFLPGGASCLALESCLQSFQRWLS